jgi:hypothetical protein
LVISAETPPRGEKAKRQTRARNNESSIDDATAGRRARSSRLGYNRVEGTTRVNVRFELRRFRTRPKSAAGRSPKSAFV